MTFDLFSGDTLVQIARCNQPRAHFVWPSLYDSRCPAINDPSPAQGAFKQARTIRDSEPSECIAVSFTFLRVCSGVVAKKTTPMRENGLCKNFDTLMSMY